MLRRPKSFEEGEPHAQKDLACWGILVVVVVLILVGMTVVGVLFGEDVNVGEKEKAKEEDKGQLVSPGPLAA